MAGLLYASPAMIQGFFKLSVRTALAVSVAVLIPPELSVCLGQAVNGRADVPHAGLPHAPYAASAGSPPTRVSSEPAAELPTTGVVVLRNGNLLRGRISPSGEYFQVATDGGLLFIRRSEVDFCADSAIEAYQRKREQIGRPSADVHLALAEWCLRNELLAQAASELMDARGLDPQHPRLALIERRLSTVHALAATPPAKPSSAKTFRNRRSASSVMPARLESDRLLSELDSLPAGTLERFTRKIQPLLVNSCSTTGCHSTGGDQEFQLSRALLHGTSTRRSTQRNLLATLQLIDREIPLESRLLRVPLEIHAGLAEPIIAPQDAHLHKTLIDWVELIVQQELDHQPNEMMEDAAVLLRIAEQGPDARALRNPMTDPHSPSALPPVQPPGNAGPIFASGPLGVPSETQAQNSEGMSLSTTVGGNAAGSNGPPTVFHPRDEFDPEIFNRRQAPVFQRPPAAPAITEQPESPGSR